jgi:hypothetical protein
MEDMNQAVEPIETIYKAPEGSLLLVHPRMFTADTWAIFNKHFRVLGVAFEDECRALAGLVFWSGPRGIGFSFAPEQEDVPATLAHARIQAGLQPAEVV